MGNNELLANTVLMDLNCYEESVIDKERYITLVDLIFNNFELSYSGNELRLKDTEAIREYIKAIEESRYYSKLKELKGEEENNK